uniref:Uncharacterized protein n=1 Tax=Glossina palpalis gambiensis TaxID=67801 RepID=A0A1B0BRY3_9MUSC
MFVLAECTNYQAYPDMYGELPAAVQHNSASDTYKGKNMEWKHIWEICLIYALFFPQIISSP